MVITSWEDQALTETTYTIKKQMIVSIMSLKIFAVIVAQFYLEFYGVEISN